MKWINTAVAIIIGLPLLLSANGTDAAYRAFKSDPARLEQFTPKFPPLTLINQDGQSISLEELFARDRNLVFAFFFTQCITICTTTTFTLKGVEPYLPENATLALISIDPDNDTPGALKEYAKLHQLEKSDWQLLTGSKADIEQFQRLLASYRSNKMNHNTAIFVKKAGCPVITEVASNFSIIPQLFQAGPESAPCE